MSNQLVIQGKALALSNYKGAVNDKGTLVGVRLFVGAKINLTAEDLEGASFKDVKALCVKAGKTKEEVKAWQKEYDMLRVEHAKDSRNLTALLVADPAFKASLRMNINRKGETIGATTVFRKEKSPRQTLENQLAAAQAEIARLKGTPVAAVAAIA